jgi:hypothetical protein
MSTSNAQGGLVRSTSVSIVTRNGLIISDVPDAPTAVRMFFDRFAAKSRDRNFTTANLTLSLLIGGHLGSSRQPLEFYVGTQHYIGLKGGRDEAGAIAKVLINAFGDGSSYVLWLRPETVVPLNSIQVSFDGGVEIPVAVLTVGRDLVTLGQQLVWQRPFDAESSDPAA